MGRSSSLLGLPSLAASFPILCNDFNTKWVPIFMSIFRTKCSEYAFIEWLCVEVVALCCCTWVSCKDNTTSDLSQLCATIFDLILEETCWLAKLCVGHREVIMDGRLQNCSHVHQSALKCVVGVCNEPLVGWFGQSLSFSYKYWGPTHALDAQCCWQMFNTKFQSFLVLERLSCLLWLLDNYVAHKLHSVLHCLQLRLLTHSWLFQRQRKNDSRTFRVGSLWSIVLQKEGKLILIYLHPTIFWHGSRWSKWVTPWWKLAKTE